MSSSSQVGSENGATRADTATVAGQQYSGTHPTIDYNSYSYNNEGALMWNWDSSLGLTDSSAYEPQGELVQELQNQQPPAHDFSIPQPVIAAGNAPTHFQLAESNLHMPNLQPQVAQQHPSPQPPPLPRAGVQTRGKRKAESEPNTANAMVASSAADAQEPAPKRVSKTRSHSASGKQPAIQQPEPRPAVAHSGSTIRAPESPNRIEPGSDGSIRPEGESATRKAPASGMATAKQQPAANKPRTVVEAPLNLVTVLPAGKVFPIQIGSELFRLSGASISSDAPSYFSQFFGEQLYSTAGRAGNVKTLYIDRDPVTFRDISLHLQGYHIKPRDGAHYVKLFADAQFYSLPRLTQQLFNSEIYIQIGHRHFEIPRDLFTSPGDSPNYFSLGFAHFFTTPTEVFPGLDRQTLLRPPSIAPPAVPNRSGDIFADLLHLLQGYPVHVRDEAHRADLLKDARYFHLKGVEQKLVPCNISYNLARETSEMLIRLEDIRQSGISFVAESVPDFSYYNSKPTTPSNSLSINLPPSPSRKGWVHYARPYIDEAAHCLILEIGGPTESTRLDLLGMRVTFHGQTKARISSLFQVIASKMNLPATQPLGLMMMQSGGGVAAQPPSPANSGVSDERVRCRIGGDAWVELDGRVLEWDEDSEEDRAMSDSLPPIRRKASDERGGQGPDLNCWVDNHQEPVASKSPAGTG